MDMMTKKAGMETAKEVLSMTQEIKGFDPDSRLNMLREVVGNMKEDIHDYFDSDKRVEIFLDGFVNISKSVDSFMDFDKRIEQAKYYTSEKARIDQTPTETSEFGQWEGERGNSKFIPTDATQSGKESLAKLSEYGLDGIEYKNGEPDFSKCSEGTVQIDNMTENRYDYFNENGMIQDGNFTQADKKLAEQWTNIGKKKMDGTMNWSEKEVASWRRENNCTWHECCDTKTMHLLSRAIHDPGKFTHSGGCAECRIRDSKDVGGIFDE